MARDFEDHCWKDIVNDEILEIYQAYHRKIFVGQKGYLGTSGRGEGVGLIPGSRWADYSLPPQMLTRSPGHQPLGQPRRDQRRPL